MEWFGYSFATWEKSEPTNNSANIQAEFASQQSHTPDIMKIIFACRPSCMLDQATGEIRTDRNFSSFLLIQI